MNIQICINGVSVFDSVFSCSDTLSFTLGEAINPVVNHFTEEAMEKFDEFRKIYAGKKRGNTTEFLNFRKRHKDFKEVIPLLLPAIQAQAKEKLRKKYNREFVPEWPNLQTWINQRRWEEEVEQPKQQQVVMPNLLSYAKP
jgi:hypothetical protein